MDVVTARTMDLPLLDGPLVAGWLVSANERGHWAKRHERTRYWRHLTAVRARGAEPFAGRAHVTVTISWPDKRRRDVANYHPTVKACVDGMVDAGIFVDDSDRYIEGPDLRRGYGRWGVDITATEIAP